MRLAARRARLQAMNLIAAALALSPGVAQQPDSSVTLRLNVPAYRLEARRDSTVIHTMPVAIGQREYRTPLGRFHVTRITWNPWWVPPKSPWAAHDTVTPPCPGNPVGRVKLSFGNGYYIHGTPKPASVGHAASHGCVRAAQDDALALAAVLISAVMPESTAAAARNAADTATRSITLARPIPLTIVYQLAEVRGDTLWLYPDPYHRMPATARRVATARRALAQAERQEVPDSTLRALVARSRRAATFLALRPQ
jgi:murein L,D-transpeptidase YcbB/YkuD